MQIHRLAYHENATLYHVISVLPALRKLFSLKLNYFEAPNSKNQHLRDMLLSMIHMIYKQYKF